MDDDQIIKRNANDIQKGHKKTIVIRKLYTTYGVYQL